MHYGVLEKFSKLHTTASSVHELARSAAQLRRDVEAELAQLRGDVRAQLDDASAAHEAQQHAKIADLADRLHAGRDRLGLLRARMTRLRERVDAWEREEREWRAKTKRERFLHQKGEKKTPPLFFLQC